MQDITRASTKDSKRSPGHPSRVLKPRLDDARFAAHPKEAELGDKTAKGGSARKAEELDAVCSVEELKWLQGSSLIDFFFFSSGQAVTVCVPS